MGSLPVALAYEDIAAVLPALGNWQLAGKSASTPLRVSLKGLGLTPLGPLVAALGALPGQGGVARPP